MTVKNGFLLIELTISLMLAFIFIFIIAHHTIEIKKIQQAVLLKMEHVSQARNRIEKTIALHEKEYVE